jgi:predicted phosphoribosyltransferase
MFIDRKDAGQKLARALEKYKGKNVMVLAIPRGGVEVAYEVAKYLNADLDLLISRKLPYPDNPEAGFGAIAEDGSTFIFDEVYRWLTEDEIREIETEQIEEIKRRIEVLRQGFPLPDLKDRIVILVDDGLAMGSTIRAAISLCKNNKVKRIIVAVPVSGDRVAREINNLVDEIVVLEMPPFFQAVAQVYVNWHDVTDIEVTEIINKWHKRKKELKKR